MKEQIVKEVEEQEAKKMRVAEDNTDYAELITKGFPVLYNISKHYEDADIEDKQAIIDSIFSEKLISKKINIEP